MVPRLGFFPRLTLNMEIKKSDRKRFSVDFLIFPITKCWKIVSNDGNILEFGNLVSLGDTTLPFLLSPTKQEHNSTYVYTELDNKREGRKINYTDREPLLTHQRQKELISDF